MANTFSMQGTFAPVEALYGKTLEIRRCVSDAAALRAAWGGDDCGSTHAGR